MVVSKPVTLEVRVTEAYHKHNSHASIYPHSHWCGPDPSREHTNEGQPPSDHLAQVNEIFSPVSMTSDTGQALDGESRPLSPSRPEISHTTQAHMTNHLKRQCPHPSDLSQSKSSAVTKGPKEQQLSKHDLHFI